MKTEPTEAYEHLRSWWFEELEDDYCTTDSANEAIKIAFKEGQSSPKIKQPEWIEQQNGLLFVPHYLGITYCIVKNKSLYWVYCQFYNNYENTSVEIARTLDEAKLMVQADFEKRIKECLE